MSPPPTFEFALNLAVIGPHRAGSSSLVRQLLDADALQECIQPGTAKQLDDEPGKCLARERANVHQPKPLAPSTDSFGLQFRSAALQVINSRGLLVDPAPEPPASDTEVTIKMRLDVLDVGGATCQPGTPFWDPQQIAYAVGKSDVVLVVYDLCDKASIIAVSTEILPAVAKFAEEKAKKAAAIAEASGGVAPPAPPLYCLVAGTMLDARMKLDAAAKPNAVAAVQQQALEKQLLELGAASVIRGFLVNSVSAALGLGIKRLRRELLFAALCARRNSLALLPVFDAQQTLWLAMALEAQMLEDAVRSAASTTWENEPQCAPSKAVIAQMQQRGGASKAAPVSAAATAPDSAADDKKDGDDAAGAAADGETPVIDAKAKKKKDAGAEDPDAKGAGCCGAGGDCVVQ